MAFCEKCGKPLEDGQKCTCEAPVEKAPAAANPVQGKAKLGLIAVAAVVVVIILIALFSGGKGYMSPVEDYMSLINKKSTDVTKISSSLMPDFAAKQIKSVIKAMEASDDFADMMADAKEEVEETYDDATDEYGKWKLSFEKKSAKKLDKDDLEEIQEEWEDNYGDDLEDMIEEMEDTLDDDDMIEEVADYLDIKEKKAKSLVKSVIKYYKSYEDLKITAGYEVKGKFVIKADDELKTDWVKFIVLKVNGDWTYYGLSEGSLYFEDDYNGYFNFVNESLYGDALFDSVGIF